MFIFSRFCLTSIVSLRNQDTYMFFCLLLGFLFEASYFLRSGVRISLRHHGSDTERLHVHFVLSQFRSIFRFLAGGTE